MIEIKIGKFRDIMDLSVSFPWIMIGFVFIVILTFILIWTDKLNVYSFLEFLKQVITRQKL